MKTGSVTGYFGRLVTLGYIFYCMRIYKGFCVVFLSPSYPTHTVNISYVPSLCQSLGAEDKTGSRGLVFMEASKKEGNQAK